MLDQVPNDLSVTLGIITEEFQTPLSHINVLSQTRKIPNMALRNAFTDPKLRALDGKWVKLPGGRHRLHHRRGHRWPRPTPGGRPTSPRG